MPTANSKLKVKNEKSGTVGERCPFNVVGAAQRTGGHHRHLARAEKLLRNLPGKDLIDLTELAVRLKLNLSYLKTFAYLIDPALRMRFGNKNLYGPQTRLEAYQTWLHDQREAGPEAPTET